MKEAINVLGQLGVGQKTNKNVIRVRCKSKVVFQVLNLLWLSGIIYGYWNKPGSYCYVYLKYNSTGNPLLRYSLIKNKRLQGKDLYNLKYLEPNTLYILWTDLGCISNTDCINLGKGGHLIAKLF